MALSARPAAVWSSLRVDETENLLINLATDEPCHVVIIPRNVTTVVFGSQTDPVSLGRSHSSNIEKAIGRAWHPGRLRELFGVNHSGHIVQLWLELDDFA